LNKKRGVGLFWRRKRRTLIGRWNWIRSVGTLERFYRSRTTGYIFTSGGGKPIYQGNFLRREFHPTLKAASVPKSGFHGFRRYRNTYLRNVAGCPDGLLKFWLGHSASWDMSDRYGKIREDAKLGRDQAEKMEVGFELPTELKEDKPQRQNKIPQICGTPCSTACAARVT
jgi:integrase